MAGGTGRGERGDRPEGAGRGHFGILGTIELSFEDGVKIGYGCGGGCLSGASWGSGAVRLLNGGGSTGGTGRLCTFLVLIYGNRKCMKIEKQIKIKRT